MGLRSSFKQRRACYLLWPISHIYSLFPIISSVSFVLGAWSNSKHGRASRGTAGDEDSAMPRLALLALIKTCCECLKFICQVLLRPRSNWPPLSRIALIAHIKLAAIVSNTFLFLPTILFLSLIFSLQYLRPCFDLPFLELKMELQVFCPSTGK